MLEKVSLRLFNSQTTSKSWDKSRCSWHREKWGLIGHRSFWLLWVLRSLSLLNSTIAAGKRMNWSDSYPNSKKSYVRLSFTRMLYWPSYLTSKFSSSVVAKTMQIPAKLSTLHLSQKGTKTLWLNSSFNGSRIITYLAKLLTRQKIIRIRDSIGNRGLRQTLRLGNDT